MIPEKRIIRRIQSGGCAIHCQDCSISQLCIPFTLNEHELDQLDNIIERKKPIQKGQTLFKAGDELKSLYAIRSGTIKSYTITEQGDEQITGFHLAGDLADALHHAHQALGFARQLDAVVAVALFPDVSNGRRHLLPRGNRVRMGRRQKHDAQQRQRQQNFHVDEANGKPVSF